MKDEITLEKILLWIIDNNKKTEAMDKISNTVFPYTTKYKKMYDRDN